MAPLDTLPFLLRHAWRHRGLTIASLAAVVLGAGFAVSAQYGLKLLVDEMTRGDRTPSNGVFLGLGLFLGLLAAESACWRLGGWLGSRLVIKVGEGIRLDLFERVASRSWTFFNANASGAIAGRILAATTAGTSVLRTVVWNVLPPLTDLFGSIVVLTTVDWHIAAGLVVAGGAATYGLHRLGRRGFPVHEAYHQEAAAVAGELVDVLGNMGLVRAYGAQGRERQRLQHVIAAEARAHSRSWMLVERLRGGHDAAFWAATAVVLVTAVWEWSRGIISTGGVVVASTLTLRVLMGSRELALSLLGLSQQLGAVTEALAVLRTSEPDPTADAPPLHAQSGAIEFRRVDYAPDGRRLLFDGLSLYIPPGQRVGIVGSSGAGKSTLLRLVQGIVAPAAGDVLLDSQPLLDASSSSLAAAFSVVTQEVELFARSIADNLRYGKPDASWDEMLLVSRAVGCDAFVSTLPEGYATVVGERGLRLSGGQRQRIAIARALLRPAPILLLDEATSALDSHAEMEVQRAIRTLAGGRTVLAVAHRLSTVMEFDRLIVLQDGRVVEDGSPEELRRAGGPFALVWRMQGRGRTAEEDAAEDAA